MIPTRLGRIVAILLILLVVGEVLFYPGTDYFLVVEVPIPHELGGM